MNEAQTKVHIGNVPSHFLWVRRCGEFSSGQHRGSVFQFVGNEIFGESQIWFDVPETSFIGTSVF